MGIALVQGGKGLPAGIDLYMAIETDKKGFRSSEVSQG